MKQQDFHLALKLDYVLFMVRGNRVMLSDGVLKVSKTGEKSHKLSQFTFLVAL